MKTFRNFIKDEFDLEMPEGDIPGSWFSENGLPMIVACICCGMTMAAPWCLLDSNGYTYCGTCAGEE